MKKRPVQLSLPSPVIGHFILVGLLLLCVWLYLPPYLDSFVGDDFVQQWRIRMFVFSPAKAYQIFYPFWTDWYYRPLQNLWFLGNRLGFGVMPFGYYFLQICWHLLAVVLLYRLARFLRLPVWAAMITAVIFAINGQHQLTVSWISSIAIVMGTVFSLAAAVTYLTYLKKPQGRWLTATVLLTLLAMLAHEEGFILPIFLFALWVSQPKRPSRPGDVGFFILLLGLMVGYVMMQIVRPNVHIAVEGDYFSRLATAVWPVNWGQFGLDVLARWLGFEGAAKGLAAQTTISTLAGVSFLLLGGLAFWAGSRAVRLGLLWLGLNLGFIYLALWSQRPELFDGRHLYNAWMGGSLAIGAALAQFAQTQVKRSRTQFNQRRATLALAAILLLFLGIHLQATQAGMASFYGLTRQVQAAEADLKAILPDLREQTQLFAARFLLTPQYFAPVAAVWYDDPELAGGSLNLLRQHEVVTDDFYVFDYEDGRLYNLMPELQAHQQTILLWRNDPQPIDAALTPYIVAGPDDDRRLAFQVSPTGSDWASLQFDETIPADAQLNTAVRGQPGQIFQILAADEVVFNHTLQPEEGWVEVAIPMNDFAGEQITIQLQLKGEPDRPAFWADPRLVID